MFSKENVRKLLRKDVKKTFEPVDNWKENANHKFMLPIICDAPENTHHRKILEAFYIKI